MRIIVVGAGIGGLSAALALSISGHRVTILESAPQLAEIGAGVQLTPDAIKFFFQWGLRDDILSKAALPGSFFIHESKTGRVLREIKISELEGEYGAPYVVVHRGVLHEILHRHGVKAGAEVRVNSRVVEYEFENGAVVLKDGERVCADLVVCCDGINSFGRQQFLKDQDKGAQKTGWAAYRMMVDVSKIQENPETSELVAQHNNHLWIGERCSAMIYMIHNATVLNMVMSHPDDVDTTHWSSERYMEEIKSLFQGWDKRDNRLTNLIEMARPTVQNWPIYQVPPLPKWISESGKFVIMGDAAHAMAFYLSMALSIFESVRKPRAEAVQRASLLAGNILHLPPGQAQVIRDATMQADGAVHKGDEKYVYGIADRATRDSCYGYDAAKEVRKEWESVSKTSAN
ncbi:uncharacterized protein Z518_07471 [Rhinocladiella mackenziei CBS 650.93]|uniref:FAD-binding domain-containing protein n=1 Tax=Rhinocladiella mackenziei CBS 650.93 TaxID=1442369 RepID=A0A0D2H0H4_9EURO|nr:uncharacterized protein Z518_07471 [Rhinocladiella mackenziei CBS 650.93]KIX03918.1 hypothetical protein Z518_07471 [Rhinocladiella mackenziei CBS 650.93]